MANTDFEKSREWNISGAKLMKAHGFAADVDHGRAFEEAEKEKELASDILRLARNTLFIHLRFLEAAFLFLVPEYDSGIDTLEIATDGKYLYYSPIHVCRLFRHSKERPARDYLHVILHCIFRHLFIGKKVRADVWDLSCDIAVENIINGLQIKAVYDSRKNDQVRIISKLQEELPRLSAEWIYRYFMEQDPSPEEVAKLAENFHADDHSIWHNTAVLDPGNGDPDENEAGEPEGGDTGDIADMSGGAEGLPEEDEEENSSSIEDEVMEPVEGKGDEGPGGSGEKERESDPDRPALTPEEIEKAWKDISERIEVELDTSAESWGEGTGDLQMKLREINREKADYTKLLKRFAVLGENIEINDDEFDYIFYSYGMELYGNMPLVEPLEYRDVKKVREFVIALDTSESVSGDIVQKFVEKTWNILKQSENFFTRVNVHIVQCGARVEEDKRITTQEEFDEYIKGMTLKGFGGTDFRPVFEHVDMLIRQKEFMNLKGLIYFTDGYGTFPHDPPAYDSAFVFLDQGYELPEVPVWAIKIVLNEDEIQQF